MINRPQKNGKGRLGKFVTTSRTKKRKKKIFFFFLTRKSLTYFSFLVTLLLTTLSKKSRRDARSRQALSSQMKAQPSKWRLITTLTSPLQKRNGRTSVIKAPCEDRKKYVYSTSKHTGFLVALLVDMLKNLTRQVEIKEDTCVSAGLYFKIQQDHRSSDAIEKTNYLVTRLYRTQIRTKPYKGSLDIMGHSSFGT